MRDLADDPEHFFTRAEVWRITLLVVGAVLALIGAGADEGLRYAKERLLTRPEVSRIASMATGGVLP
jgi:hypothetical protein